MCAHNFGYTENDRYWVCLMQSVQCGQKGSTRQEFPERMNRCRMLQHCVGMESTLPYMKGGGCEH